MIFKFFSNPNHLINYHFINYLGFFAFCVLNTCKLVYNSKQKSALYVCNNAAFEE